MLELSGRGMAALLLDNEALGQDYLTATMGDILRDHVTPYGIEVAQGANLPAVEQFSVSTGSSEWSVVYEFARYYGGTAPRFDRKGRLVLTGWQDSQAWLLGDGVPVTELVCRDKRYGVLSQVLVRDRYSGETQTVENSTFAANGGRARQIMTMPGRSNYKAMRYTGQFQLDKSASELERLEVTVAQPFCAWPGELVRVQRSNWERNGLFRVAQATVGMDSGGYWTKLELGDRDLIV
jgi:prophage tail gpP-like protein